ncbi:hypothetical protein QGM60_16010 [Winogradskyella sp. SYSU M77433]|nr:hypothetical protein [Winogradskyella sp. SYSU M77433]
MTTTKENSVIPEIVKPSENNKITTAGIANAALGFGAATLTQHLFTPKHQKNATKEDIQKLSSLIKGQRYFLVNNLPIDQFRRKPFYDIETGNVIYL